MLSRAAISKLQVILVIDLMIVASATGAYYYIRPLLPTVGSSGSINPPPELADFRLSNLQINRAEAQAGQPIIIAVDVTNIGLASGSYTVDLRIDDALRESKPVQLSGNTTTTVDFTVTETAEGPHTVKIGDLTGTFKITAGGGGIPQSRPSDFSLVTLFISPQEPWPGTPIKITATLVNYGAVTGNYPVSLKINNAQVENKIVQIEGGAKTGVEFTVTEANVGTYSVTMNSLTGQFTVIPTGTHTLSIISFPPNVIFTIDGISHTAPYSGYVKEGTHTITMPEQTDYEGVFYPFDHWSGGSKDLTKTISLTSRMLIEAFYAGGGGRSCPSLYVWNGIEYVYCTEVSSGTGYLGILDYFRADGTIAFAYSYPWDYIKLEGNQLQPIDGYYEMKLTQRWDEIFYLDAAQLLVVDHSPDVDVFSTKGTYIYNLDGQGKIYTVSKNLLTPISAVNDAGEDILPQISKLDGIYTTDHEFQYDNYTLNLGDLSNAKEIKLIVAGKTLYSSGQEQGELAAKFATQPGVKPFPPPYMEVKDSNGSWVRVPDNRQFPLLDVTPNRFVVNLTGLFPTNDYSLRIHNFFNAPFDYIAVDTTPQQDAIIHQVDPVYADLYQVLGTTSTSTGNFTRYGDVTLLMLEADDKFVIGRQGDEVSLKFPTDEGPVPEGMERDYFLFVSCWFKVDGLPYLGFTVEPLPFHNMSCFPYLSTESYPYDRDHLNYLLEYNIRTIAIS